MNATLTQIKNNLNKLLASGGNQALDLSEANLGLTGFASFLKEASGQESLSLKQAGLNKPEEADKVVVTGVSDLFGEKDLAVTFSITATGDTDPLRTIIQFPWPTDKTMPFGSQYQLRQVQFKLVWLGNNDDGKPLQYGLISGNMTLGTITAPMQIRFPATPDSVFVQSAFEKPRTLDKGLKQLAEIALIPELADFLPDTAVKVISSLALDQVGILYNTKDKKIRLVSVTLSAAGWELVKGGFAIEDLQLSLQAEGFGSETTTVTAELDADLVIEKAFRIPLFIRIESGILSIGKASTERIQLPSLSAALKAIGESAITDSWPDSFKNAAITIDTLQVSYDTAAQKLGSVYFQASIADLQLEPGFALKYLGLGFSLDKQGNTSSISGNFMSVLLLGTKDPVELDLSAMLSVSPGGNFWQCNARAENINVGELIKTLLEVFDADLKLPAQLSELVIAELGLSFSKAARGSNTQSDYRFTCQIKYPKDGQKADVTLVIIYSKSQPAPAPGQKVTQPKASGGYYIAISGKIVVSGKEFDLDLDMRSENNITTELLIAKAVDVDIDLKELAEGLIDNKTVIEFVPPVTISPKYALIARVKAGSTAVFKTLTGLDLDLKIDLKGLPLVGKMLGNADFQVKDLQFQCATESLTLAEVQEINKSAFLPAKFPEQPVDGTSTNPTTTSAAASAAILAKGFGFKASLLLGALEPFQIAMPVRAAADNAPAGGAGTPAPTGETSAVSPPVADSDATWIDIQRAIGPVHVDRVGFRYKDKMIWGYFDASLGLGGLTLSLDGLGIGNPVNKFDPSFTLKGLGLDYRQDPVEIGGSFLHTLVSEDKSKNIPAYDGYDGMATIKVETLNIAALGSYAQVNGHNSLFLYAILNYPIGGPSFFFVTGLAAGFGYNRAFRMPAITGVAQFPLVDEAVNGAGSGPPGDDKGRREFLQTEITRLRDAIYPAPENFLVAGVRFSSFKMIDSFALVSVSFGQHFEVDVLGLSTMIVPTPEPGQTVTPVAEVQLALKAVFNPEEGVLSIEAQLTSNSYLFSRACHLTGGFAFYCWFKGEHKGDFVITLGGYHPRYVVPKHYPAVPRLGFNWTVSEVFSMKGEAYFALTAHALMAGGKLEALYHDDSIKAWFVVGADFIISWKPYFYDARMYVEIGASYTFHHLGSQTISASASADLHIWGPEFSGEAEVHLWIISFTVKFGNAAPKPRAIDWNTFQSSFLPDADKIVTVTVTDGLVRENDKSAFLNPKDMCLTVGTQIPVKTFDLGLETAGKDQLPFADPGQQIILPIGADAPAPNTMTPADFGIAPMDVASVATSFMKIDIRRDRENPVNSDFNFTPVLKRMPRGMWGDKLTAETNGAQFIENALAGFEIRPANPAVPGETHRVLKKSLQYEVDKQANAFACPAIGTCRFSGQAGPGPGKTTPAADKRNRLFEALGLDTRDMHVPAFDDTYFVEKPLAATFAS